MTTTERAPVYVSNVRLGWGLDTIPVSISTQITQLTCAPRPNKNNPLSNSSGGDPGEMQSPLRSPKLNP